MRTFLLVALLGIICATFTMTGCLTSDDDDYDGESGACYYNNGLFSTCRDNVSSPNACADLHAQTTGSQFVPGGHCN